MAETLLNEAPAPNGAPDNAMLDSTQPSSDAQPKPVDESSMEQPTVSDKQGETIFEISKQLSSKEVKLAGKLAVREILLIAICIISNE